MFTGLIAELGTVDAMQRTEDGARLRVRGALARKLSEGDSIAVNGVCLTATAVDGGAFCADVMAETLRRSCLEDLAAGDSVNLELPLRASDRLGGHFVQGHVDGVGEVGEVRDDGFALLVRIAAPPGLRRYLAEKGSVAVDGISLTIAALHDDGFSVALIPETLARTNLAAAAPGTRVNLEVDVLAKYAERLVAR